MTTFLSIDPGTTTGIAWWDSATDGFGALQIRGRRTFQRYLLDDWHLGFGEMWETTPDDLEVIAERWDVRKDTHGKSAQEDPRYILGGLDLVCYLQEIPYHEQTPAQAKSFCGNDKLRTLGWYTGGEGHADDAARHLVTFLAKHPKGGPIREAIV
jgi:hypothetical protein